MKIPLTTSTGKIRIKQRDNIYGYGQPFPSKSMNFNQKNYVEWQISYDIEENNEKINFSVLKQYKFIAHNGKNKLLFELSEYLYHLINFGLISLLQIKKLKNFINNLTENELLSNHPHCEIKRTHPKIQKINDLNFEILKVEYPQLIYRFKNY
ncbi:MAG: hypothetical protein N2319_11350 [Candidatus Kapabacteria bacterium]|nr:hypothetical protein [Candidatus Kapabacteria bacterium]